LRTGCCEEYLDLRDKKKEEDRGNSEMNFMMCALHQILLVLSNREDEVGWTCGTHGEEERVFTGFWLGGPKARDHWED
jgi:hypothetical protein